MTKLEKIIISYLAICLPYNCSVTLWTCPQACNLSGCHSDSQSDCWDNSGPGGGGSGGSIYLAAKYVNVGELFFT